MSKAALAEEVVEEVVETENAAEDRGDFLPEDAPVEEPVVLDENATLPDIPEEPQEEAEEVKEEAVVAVSYTHLKLPTTPYV